MTPIRLRALDARLYRAPIPSPVTTSFGVMTNRPTLLIRAEDQDGAVGWGEVWCNFPSVGPEYRVRLINHVIAPLAIGQSFDGPADAFAALTARTAVLALQSGEPGPFANGIAGIDLALWDLQARRAGVPLFRLLGGTNPQIQVYASGLNPDGPAALAAERQAEGHRAFKLKIGFGHARDRANLQSLRDTLGDGAALMADANQAWSLEQALDAGPALKRFGLAWLEEPLRADRPWPEWQALAARLAVPLAAGENLSGEAFGAAVAAGALGVIQPDAGKWGGVSAVLPVARAVVAAGLSYCPHWLGGGIGLLASAHLLAAAGGPGALEIDSNPNPLRAQLCGPLIRITEGAATLGEQPGLGAAPDEAMLKDFAVAL